MENNEARIIPPQDEAQNQKKTTRILWLVGMVASLVWLVFATRGYVNADGRERWFGAVLIPFALALICASEGFGFPLSRAFQWTFGRVRYEQLDSQRMDARTRRRFHRQIQELEGSGFVPVFGLGETFPLAQMLLVLPAIIIAMMLVNREVLYVRKGRIGIAHPVFVSSDRKAMAHIFGLGAKFYTSFTDGTLVVTKSFRDRLPDTPQVMKQGGKGSITVAWNDHQEQVRRLVASGKSIDDQSGFDFYASMLDKG